MSKVRDRRFTVSIAADVADNLDKYVSMTKNSNRSAVVEEALRLWETLSEFDDKPAVVNEAIGLYQKRKERELYQSYYEELSEAATAEDAAWANLSKQSSSKNWPTADIELRSGKSSVKLKGKR